MYLNSEGIDKIVKEFENDTKAIKNDLFKICWYMRGGITITESYSLTVEDREIISKIIEENLKTTKETNLPFF